MKSPIQRRRKQRIIGSLLLIVILLATGFLFRTKTLQAVAYVQRPLVAAGTYVSDHTIGLFDRTRVSQSAVAELTAQRDLYAINRAELEMLRRENAKLKEQLGYVERSERAHVTASIVARTSDTQTTTFVIDRGEYDGVSEGDPVIVRDGILVGVVTGVTSASATVSGITDTQTTTAASLLNQSQTLGIVSGAAGDLLHWEYIPQDESIEVNDLVVTSGLDPQIPGGLVIGRVNTVRQDPVQPFQTAVVEPLVDMRYFHLVTVITSE